MSVSSKRSNVRLTLGANPYYHQVSTPHAHTREKTNLVGITTDARHPANTKIERCQFVPTIFTICETSLFQKGNDERTETAINVETNVVFRRQCTERDDIVLIAIRKVDRRTYELRENRDESNISCNARGTHHDGIAVSERKSPVRKMMGKKIKYEHGSAYALQVRLARDGVDGHRVELDAHISRTFIKCSMCSDRDDPVCVVNPVPVMNHTKKSQLTSQAR